jgi:predicted nucleic acid-binding protein
LKVLFDTNVVLDVLLDRKPFSGIASRLFARVERGELSGILGATTVTTLHYLLTKSYGRDQALRRIRILLQLFAIAAVDRHVLELAAALAASDFEDAVLHEAGRLYGAEAIVTRDPQGFREATLLILSPADLEAALS